MSSTSLPPPPDGPSKTVEGTALRILIVDDERDFCMVWEDEIRRVIPGSAVVSANSFSQAERLMSETRFDAALVDEHMGPAMSTPEGKGSLWVLTSAVSHIPLRILLTGYREEIQNEDELQQAGIPIFKKAEASEHELLALLRSLPRLLAFGVQADSAAGLDERMLSLFRKWIRAAMHELPSSLRMNFNGVSVPLGEWEGEVVRRTQIGQKIMDLFLEDLVERFSIND